MSKITDFFFKTIPSLVRSKRTDTGFIKPPPLSSATVHLPAPTNRKLTKELRALARDLEAAADGDPKALARVKKDIKL